MSKTQKKAVVTKSPASKKPVPVLSQKPTKKTIIEDKKIRSGTKQSILITLLNDSKGATVNEMAEATDWQNHSVQGVMSGVLKKRLGLTIISKVEERGRVYRIAG
jgi:hypothetical protein